MLAKGPVADAGIADSAGALWSGLAGPGLAGLSAPAGFSGGVLTVRTSHPGAVLELRAREAELIAGLNEAMGRPLIKRIRITRDRGRHGE